MTGLYRVSRFPGDGAATGGAPARDEPREDRHDVKTPPNDG